MSDGSPSPAATDAEFRTLCQIMGDPGLADDPRFADSLNRYQNRRELDEAISRWTAEQDARETMHRLQAAGVPAGMVMDESDVHADPQVAERNFFQEVTHPEAGTHKNPTTGFKLQNTPYEIRRHAVHARPGQRIRLQETSWAIQKRNTRTS